MGIIIPKIGMLYEFRKDNVPQLIQKYQHYYVGLLLCIQVDVIADMSDSQVPSELKEYIVKNPIFGFETYNCVQFYGDISYLHPVGIKVADVLYLNFKEVNDMLQIARAD